MAAADWPCYRGEFGDGVCHEDGLLADWPTEGPKIVWSAPIRDDGNGTHSGASVVGERVYVPGRTGDQDVIYCLNAETGETLWQYAYAAPAKDEVYGTGIRIAPTVAAERVYTLGCFGQLLCLDSRGGLLLWRRNLLDEFKGKMPSFGMASAPLAVDGKLICEPGGPGAAVTALDPATGKALWKSGDDEISYAAPQVTAIAGVRQVIAFLAPGVVSYDLQTGAELWRFDYRDERAKNVPAPIIAGDRIFLANNTLGFTSIQAVRDGARWSVKKVWAARKEKMHFSCPVSGDGCIYFHDGKRAVKCLDMADGSEKWSAPNMGREQAVLLRLTERRLLAALDSGELVLLDVSPHSFQEKARFQALGKAFLQPAIAGGRLFVRDHEKLICFELRAAAGVTPAAVVHAPVQKPVNVKTLHADFNSSWKKTHNLYFLVWLTGLLLSVMGISIVKNSQLAAGIAATEVSTLGMALAMWVSGMFPLVHWLQQDRILTIGAVVFGAGCSLALGLSRRRAHVISPLKNWAIILIPAAGIYLFSRSQLSAVDVPSALFSTVIRDTRSEVGSLTVITVVSLALALADRFVFSPRGQEANAPVKKYHGLWAAVVSVWFGAIIGWSIHSSGMLFTLGCLLLPVLAVRRLYAGKWVVILVPVVALAAITAGFVSMHHSDRGAQAAVAIMGAVFVAVALGAVLMPRATATK